MSEHTTILELERARAAQEPTHSGPNADVVCHAPGERCLGCAHYYGKAAVCKYAAQEPDGWVAVSERLPDRRVPIEMTGASGYIPPHDRFVISGYYDAEYRPRSPWLDSTGTCTSDMAWYPTHWRYLRPLPIASERTAQVEHRTNFPSPSNEDDRRTQPVAVPTDSAPDRYCITQPDGECVGGTLAGFPPCMHDVPDSAPQQSTRDTERAALVAEIGECCHGSDPLCAGGCLVERAARKRSAPHAVAELPPYTYKWRTKHPATGQIVSVVPKADYDALRIVAKQLRRELAGYSDTEADGVVFCGKCGRAK